MADGRRSLLFEHQIWDLPLDHGVAHLVSGYKYILARNTTLVAAR